MASLQTIRKVNRAWIRRGDQTRDEFDKFLCYWIAFNGLYSYVSGKTQDSVALTAIKKSSHFRRIFSDIVTEDGSSLKRLKALSPPVRDARNYKKPPKVIVNNTLSEVIDALYQVRCNLFHGNKEENSQRDRQVIRASVPMLRDIVKTFSENIWTI